MIFLMLVIAIPSCFVEYKLTNKKPAIRRFFAQHKIAALAFSNAVSAVFGIIFGAAGVIVFGASMISTMVMVIVYGLQPTIDKNIEGFQAANSGFKFILNTIFFFLILPFRILGFGVKGYRRLRRA